MLSQILLKLNYRILELISISPVKSQTKRNLMKNCFIYYDYEREFSSHDTNILDSDVEHILNHLDQLQLKTTWFTVGKVMERYPETIAKIVEMGHEIGSHTFAHVPPNEMSRINMKSDFEKFEEERSRKKLLIRGFHSPKGQWSISMFRHLINNRFNYDVISLPITKNQISVMKYNFHKTRPIIRLVTIGDDWPLFKAQKSRLEVFNYFKRLYEKTKPGDTFGIGFHPWILYSDTNILLGYKDFLSYIKKQNNIIINPATFFVENTIEQFNKRKNLSGETLLNRKTC